MVARYAAHARVRDTVTPQSEPIRGRESEMAENAAGGFTFVLDHWSALDRFLILGTEGGSYYASEKKMTKDALVHVQAAIAEDGPRAVTRAVDISRAGRAAKNDPALMVLALCAASADVKTRQAALAAVPAVARTGTHLFQFAEMAKGQRGWGSALRKAIAAWYLHRPLDGLAFQVVKYRQRDGWTHRDLLRLTHPKADAADTMRRAVFNWICGRATDTTALPAVIRAFEELKVAEKLPDVMRIIAGFQEGDEDGERERGFPREAIPSQWLDDPRVQGLMLRHMPMMAMLRNLGSMSKSGALAHLSENERLVVEAFGDKERLRESRLHPFAILLALKTYASGKGFRGNAEWPVNQRVVDALDAAFYDAFENVEPTGKRFYLGLDISGSMDSPAMGSSLSCREAVGALAMVAARTERATHIAGFCAKENGARTHWGNTGMVDIRFGTRDSLSTVAKQMSEMRMGGTDCALPMLDAMERKIPVDVFVVMTDNETWAGGIQPAEALRQYRKAMGIPAKLVVVGMTATNFSIADPKDAGMLDVVGFDANMPALLREFALA